jgi:ATP-dependent Clp protease protease subunit
MAMSAGALVLCGGTAGKRFALPNAKMMIHQGSAGFQGTPADIDIHAREIISLRQRYAEVISLHSKRPIDQVERDIDRDRFMDPLEATAYGLIDEVLAARTSFTGYLPPPHGSSNGKTSG